MVGALNELALFAGAGGGILGGALLGWRTVCAVEFAAYPRSVLLARQRDGMLPRFPIWDDVRTFDGRPWRGRVDVITGGFPCQDISVAGGGAGLDGERSGLWREMARIIGEVRPRFALVENSPMLTSRGLGVVLGDLASMGFNAEWGVLGADDAGAPHVRKRVWILAYSEILGGSSGAIHGRNEFPALDGGKTSGVVASGAGPEDVANPNGSQRQGIREPFGVRADRADFGGVGWWHSEPDVGRVANGVASRVDRLKAIGNGQVPAVAALAWRTLLARAGW